MEVHYLFAGIGLIILIGFMGTLMFHRTKIPDILILLFIGLLIGPILTNYTNIGLLGDPEFQDTLEFIAPHFMALALVIILFDGGLNLNLDKTVRKLGLSIIHAGICFVGLMVVTALICVYVLNMDLWVGLLLGAAIGGGPSGPVVIPLLLKSSAKEDTRILLTLESVLTDVLCIVAVVIIIEILRGSALDTGALISGLLSSFFMAAVIAFIFGIFWLIILKKLEGKPFSFMITIAALFVVYAICEYLPNVSGPIAALVFGLVLGNKDEIARILKFRGSFVLDEHIRQFHSELSFVVRTFFFVYLGLTFTFALNSDAFANLADFVPHWISWHPLLVFAFLMSLIFIGLLLIRGIATSVTCSVHKESKEDKGLIFTMMGRGLAAGVVATLPFTIPAFLTAHPDFNPAYYEMMAPYRELFLNVAFMIIILSVVVTSIGVAVIERGREKAGTAVPADGGDWEARSPTYRKAKEAAPTPKPAGREGPKPWADPHTPPARPQQRPPPRHAGKHTPPAAKQAHVQAQPVKHHQTARHEPKHPPRKHAPPPPRDHPLVKRAAESEKKQPRKPKK